MAKKETKHEAKEMIEAVPEEIKKLEELEKVMEKVEQIGFPERSEEQKLGEIEQKPKKKLSFEEKKVIREKETRERSLETWIPKTQLGKAVKHGKEKDLDKILEKGKKILEAEIVDTLLPNLGIDLILIGQVKGKFGGGKRRAWKQTQKKTKEGNILKFTCMAVVGDRKGHIGVGLGSAKETLPSREKAIRKAKLNIIKITRGFESPEEDSAEYHTVPFAVEGKCGSSRITLLPAPRGTGLVVADECKKILKLAGIKDVYSKTKGQTKTTFNLAKACINALNKTNKMKL